MSSKTQSPAGLQPKLRFSEFRDKEGWAPEPMGEVYSFKSNNSLSRDKLNYVAGSVKNIHYGDIHTKFSSHFNITKELVPFINESEEGIVRDENLCAEGDMIFADASEDLADIGKCIEIVHLNGERVVSGLHTILARRIAERIALGFGEHLFKSGWVRTQIQKEAQGAKVLGISPTRLRNLRLPLPHDKAEQQKIADCLSSVDELITAQAQKVEALKAHKKGLMQQLFPAEGETLPQLRFPEFHGTEGWNADGLGDVTDFVNEKIPLERVALENYVSTENILPDFGGVARASKLPTTGSVTRYRPNDTLVSNIRPYLKKVWVADKEGGASNDVIVIRAKQRLLPQYLSCLLKNDVFIDFVMTGAKGVKMPRGDVGSMKAYPSLYPTKPEQERIAECLNSLDNLITTQTQKLEVLKTHKKGLMQQLFPTISGVQE